MTKPVELTRGVNFKLLHATPLPATSPTKLLVVSASTSVGIWTEVGCQANARSESRRWKASSAIKVRAVAWMNERKKGRKERRTKRNTRSVRKVGKPGPRYQNKTKQNKTKQNKTKQNKKH